LISLVSHLITPYQSAPHRIQRLIQQKRYLTAVNTLNKAITVMFGEVRFAALVFLLFCSCDLRALCKISTITVHLIPHITPQCNIFAADLHIIKMSLFSKSNFDRTW